MHVYSPTDDEAALKQFQGDVSSRFSNDANVVMGRIMMKAGGPHPCSQFEVDFTRTAFADIASWAMFNRPEEMSILFHALDENQVEAHSSRAMWLGKALDLKLEPLKKFDSLVAAKISEGASRNEVLCKMLKAGGGPSRHLLAEMRAQEAQSNA
ncbi:g7063 [Coccomyxa viridis]|uniref:G7063 protein n=1 Tax=Coccomyxa viridis TaxID=1274662 RepID=A0ABP1G0W8_9CHLO